MKLHPLCVLPAFTVAPSIAGDAVAQPFDNIEIVVGVQDVPAVGGPAVGHARTWEERTGAKVRVVHYFFGDLFSKFKRGIATDPAAFDVIIYASAWARDFYKYLSPLPPEVYQDETFDDVHPTYRERLMTWDGEWIAVTLDGDLFSGYYRRDLFADPRNRTEFAKQYGYELGPPQTWAEYRDIAEFFTGRTGPKGRKIWGASEAFARNGQQFWDVFSRASAYVDHPNNPGSQFFDPETMKAQVDNPGWIRAVKEYLEILKFNPPGRGLPRHRQGSGCLCKRSGSAQPRLGIHRSDRCRPPRLQGKRQGRILRSAGHAGNMEHPGGPMGRSPVRAQGPLPRLRRMGGQPAQDQPEQEYIAWDGVESCISNRSTTIDGVAP
jgi:hypothetical protein